MLTYQLREHVLKIEEGESLDFPSHVKIEFTFCPSPAFGIVTEQGRTVYSGDTPKFIFNANTGRQYVQPSLVPNQIAVDIMSKQYETKLVGNKFLVKTHCNTSGDLIDFIDTIYYGFPILLNLDFHDSPVIECTCGVVGNTSFTWQHKTAAGTFDVTTKEIQEQRVVDAWERMILLTNHPAKRRLLAALQYFYTACRLFEAGNSPAEFMAEIILNYCKVLQVLFPDSKDAARQGLAKLDYSEEEIERDFIPAMDLRNKIDIGHAKLSLFSQSQLNVLHNYVNAAEGAFRSMLQRLFAKVESGTDIVPQDPTSAIDRDTAKIIQRLDKCFGTE